MATESPSAAANAARKHNAPTPPDPCAADPAASDSSPIDALRSLGRDAAELKDYATYFLAAKADAVKLSLRRAMVYAALGIAGLIVLAAALGTAVVLLFLGLSGLINGIVHSPRLTPWLGHLIVAVLFLAAVGAGIYWGMGRFTKASRKRTVDKYEQRRRQQSFDHGHNVHERAESV